MEQSKKMTSLKMPSVHQIGDTVDVNFANSHYLKDCLVTAVKITYYGKVFYDVEVPVGFENERTILGSIDDALVTHPINVKAVAG